MNKKIKGWFDKWFGSPMQRGVFIILVIWIIATILILPSLHVEEQADSLKEESACSWVGGRQMWRCDDVERNVTCYMASRSPFSGIDCVNGAE